MGRDGEMGRESEGGEGQRTVQGAHACQHTHLELVMIWGVIKM